MTLILTFPTHDANSKTHLNRYAKDPSELSDEVLRKANLPIHIVTNRVQNYNCYSSKDHFNACVAMLQSILSYFEEEHPASPQLLLAPASFFITYSPEGFKIEADLGSVLLGSRAAPGGPADDPGESIESNLANLSPGASLNSSKDKMTRLKELKKKQKAERVIFSKAWDELYEKREKSRISFEKIRDHVVKKVLNSKNSYRIVPQAYNAYLSVLVDPHTYIKPDLSEFMQGGDPSFFGIGTQISRRLVGPDQVESQTEIVIEAVMEDSPAQKAGLAPQDIILEVDGNRLQGKTDQEAVKLIRGPKGTPAQLKIKRGQEILSISIVRDEIVKRSVKVRMLTTPQRTRVGYIRLRDFSESGLEPRSLSESGVEPRSLEDEIRTKTRCGETAQGIRKMKDEGAQAFVLDLRENPGGLIVQAQCIVSLFVEKGKPVVNIQNIAPRSRSEQYSTYFEPITDLPVITLINSGSASASEIVSGALQDYGRSLILGLRSFGKGSVQTLSAVPLDADLQPFLRYFDFMVTTHRFYLPSGRTNQVAGVHPDITVYPHPAIQSEEDLPRIRREEDIYTNALPPQGTPWIQPRRDYVQTIEQCMISQGKAHDRFEQEKKSPIPPDFQLLSSEDAVDCVLRKEKEP